MRYSNELQRLGFLTVYRDNGDSTSSNACQVASLQWRHNGHDGVSNHQPYDCFFNRLFRHRSKKTSRLRVTGLCAENSPVTGEFPAQRASNVENVSIWWRHHDTPLNHSPLSYSDITWAAWLLKSPRLGVQQFLQANINENTKLPITASFERGVHRWPAASPHKWPVKQKTCNITDNKGSWGTHGAHMGHVGPSWAPRWPHKPCHQGCSCESTTDRQLFQKHIIG